MNSIPQPPQHPPTPSVSPATPPQPPIAPKLPKYDFSTPEAARHALRVICDEEGLTVEQKNLLSQVVHCESGYYIHAKHPNLYNGKEVSCDFGICQWNNKYHGSEITPDEAMNNPEKAIRLMCQYVKRGLIKQWVCFSANLYLKYTP